MVVSLRVASSRLAWSRQAIHPAQSRPSRRRPTTYAVPQGDRVVLAAFHFPLLVACTRAFHLSAYSVVDSADSRPSQPRHLDTLHSDVSFHPASLSLFPGLVNQFRVDLTFCAPLYPSSWTIAVQEFVAKLGVKRSLSESLPGEISRGVCHVVGQPAPTDPLEWPRKVRPPTGIRGRVIAVGCDGRWCVLAGEGNQILVFALPATKSVDGFLEGPANAASVDLSSTEDRQPIVHVQTLIAHSSSLTSISLAAGRVVTGSRDGRVLLWELDEDVDEDDLDPHRGRTVGYVEVRPGGRRALRSRPPVPQGPELTGISHPAAISAAARAMFLPRPPEITSSRVGPADDDDVAIQQLTFDEERIVGLVKSRSGDIMRVWNFNG